MKKIFAVLALGFILSASAIAGDGTDPLPLCRAGQPKCQFPPTTPPPVVAQAK